jgi:hypothetical protein
LERVKKHYCHQLEAVSATNALRPEGFQDRKLYLSRNWKEKYGEHQATHSTLEVTINMGDLEAAKQRATLLESVDVTPPSHQLPTNPSPENA